MAVFPQSATGLNYITYPVGPAGAGLTLTSSGSTNTKGSYTQAVASSTFACNRVVVDIVLTNANLGRQYLLDIATGAGGAEVVLIPDLLGEGTNAATSAVGGTFDVAAAIASSTRIAARCACSTATQTMQISLTLVSAGGSPGVSTVLTNFGSGTTHASGGKQIDPGATADTKGSYVQLTASTSAVIQYLLLMYSLGGATFVTVSPQWAVDVATGAAASEVVLIPDVRVTADCGTTPRPVIQPKSHDFLTYIAASTRLAIRASCSTNDATDRLFDIALVAGTAPTEGTLLEASDMSGGLV